MFLFQKCSFLIYSSQKVLLVNSSSGDRYLADCGKWFCNTSQLCELWPVNRDFLKQKSKHQSNWKLHSQTICGNTKTVKYNISFIELSPQYLHYFYDYLSWFWASPCHLIHISLMTTSCLTLVAVKRRKNISHTMKSDNKDNVLHTHTHTHTHRHFK